MVHLYPKSRSPARPDGISPARGCTVLVACLALVLVACAASPEEPAFNLPEIERSEDLIRELRAAGAQVVENAASEFDYFGVEGQRLQVGGAEVHIFEFADPEARRERSEGIAPDGLSMEGRPLVWPDRPNIWAAGRVIVVYPGTDGGMMLLLSGLLGDPITFRAPAVDEPYPPAVLAAIQALADDLALEPGEIEVIEFQTVEWADSCLELGSADELCAQAITPGWRIELQAAEASYVIHTDSLGEAIRHNPAGP